MTEIIVLISQPGRSLSYIFFFSFSPVIWDSPFSPYTNDLKFPFPPSEPLAWDFPLLPWRTVTCASAHQISCYSSSSLSKHKEGEKNPTPSYQLLQAAVSLGKNVTPHLSVGYGTGLGFLGKNCIYLSGVSYQTTLLL